MYIQVFWVSRIHTFSSRRLTLHPNEKIPCFVSHLFLFARLAAKWLESLLSFERDRRGSRRDGDDRWLESRLRLERARREADFRCLEGSRLRFEWLECDAWWWPEFSLLSFEGDRASFNRTCRADES